MYNLYIIRARRHQTFSTSFDVSPNNIRTEDYFGVPLSNLIEPIITSYLNLVYELASIKIIEVSTAYPLPTVQKDHLTQKLKDLFLTFNIFLRLKVVPNMMVTINFRKRS